MHSRSLHDSSVLNRTMKKRAVRFGNVTELSFPRQQGHSCIPSKGDLTLGMAKRHCSIDHFTIDDYEKKKMSRVCKEKYNISSSSQNNQFCDKSSYQPIPLQDRLSILKEAGIETIDGEEKKDCKLIRSSREACGCECRDYCDPDVCSCIIAEIPCQIERANFPCGCNMENCKNPNGCNIYNLAKVQTHYHRTIRKLKAEQHFLRFRKPVMEAAFANSGKKEGLEIWRVENFKPVPYPIGEYGKFYTGDSYIVLKTSRSLKYWEIFFWLGAETTQDESGAAAILSVQLDDQLGGGPIQHREVQDHESNNFLSLFPSGVRYLPGGVTSGFTHFTDEKQIRLFQVKGLRNVRVKQVDATVLSMNKGDCFILDSGSKILVYVGVRSRVSERLKAVQAASNIRDQDHAGKGTVEIIDEFSSDDDFAEFFSTLGSGSKDQVAEESDDDREFEKSIIKSTTLYRVSDASGSLKTEKVGETVLTQEMLDTMDCFILDTDASIFVWIGKGCTANERKGAMSIADKFISDKNYPTWTHVQRVVEGNETGTFTQHFTSWDIGHAAARLIHAHIPPRGANFKTEEIFNFTQKDLFEGDIMLLEQRDALFVWIGKDADDDEKAKCGDLAKKYVAKLGRKNMKIKHVNQGEEPAEFKNFFPAWNDTFWDKVDYKDLTRVLQGTLSKFS